MRELKVSCVGKNMLSNDLTHDLNTDDACEDAYRRGWPRSSSLIKKRNWKAFDNTASLEYSNNSGDRYKLDFNTLMRC